MKGPASEREKAQSQYRAIGSVAFLTSQVVPLFYFSGDSSNETAGGKHKETVTGTDKSAVEPLTMVMVEGSSPTATVYSVARTSPEAGTKTQATVKYFIKFRANPRRALVELFDHNPFLCAGGAFKPRPTRRKPITQPKQSTTKQYPRN